MKGRLLLLSGIGLIGGLLAGHLNAGHCYVETVQDCGKGTDFAFYSYNCGSVIVIYRQGWVFQCKVDPEAEDGWLGPEDYSVTVDCVSHWTATSDYCAPTHGSSVVGQVSRTPCVVELCNLDEH
jgi:hypothetical protein